MVFLHEGKKLVGRITVHSTDRDSVVKMVPWATITGRVLTPEGKPAARAEVSFQLIDRIADGMVRQKLYRDKPRSALRTDGEGRFRLEGMFPGLELQVFARTPGLSFSRSSPGRARPSASGTSPCPPRGDDPARVAAFLSAGVKKGVTQSPPRRR
jgi:hypothetical protein